jgi:glucose-1-phosphate adenylyltransferase
MVASDLRVFAYPYNGYWIDVGTVDAYWAAHMDLLETPPSLDLNDRTWIIHTRSEERPSVHIHSGANIINSMITDGTVVASGATSSAAWSHPASSSARGPSSAIRSS